MISQTAHYALRAVVCLASKPETPMTTEQLANITKVPLNYLSKVMQVLVREDLVTSKPGKMGGFILKMPPERISLLRVIEAFDTPVGEDLSPVEIQGYGNILRPLHQKLSRLQSMIRNECQNVYIKDLL